MASGSETAAKSARAATAHDNPLAAEVAKAAMAGVTETSHDKNKLSPAAITATKPELVANMTEKIAASPGFQHITNTEPWYQSRVTLGVILTAASSVAGIFGYTFTPEMQGNVLNAVIALSPLVLTLAGAVISFIGRWISRKPLGAK